ncbi:alpha-lytic protease prodomain-containing protein [Streptomyces minutiscleroticus]|uniref:alpha-lytic protease prodomain-containing protein n=1 Tax=Streptomyces minutiscleroticus TaxID=68238 RepID=UPI003D9F59BC
MVHRHTRAACAVLTTVGAVVLTAAPASGVADPPPPATGPSAARTLGADRPHADVLRALQRDLGLSAAQAGTRLVNEAEAGTRAGRLQNALGAHFAGAWVQGPTSAHLVVATTDAAHVRAIEEGGATARLVRTGLADLRAVKEKLDAAAHRSGTLDTPVRYVDVRTNRVVLQATDRAAADRLLADAGVDRALVDVRLSADRPRALYDIKGGEAYYIDEQARCSIGFSITKGDEQGFVSAGHCGKPGAKTTGANQAAQGTFKASTFPEKDMSWVATNAEWTATPTVKGEGGKDVQVAGSVQALVGAAVCRSGSTTGWHCGEIEQHDTSVTYAEGTVNGVTRTSVCAEPGDSGGSYVSGSQAQGVTSGGSGDCRSGGTTFYQPVNPILETYGLTLKTGTEQGTPPPGDPTTPPPGDPSTPPQDDPTTPPPGDPTTPPPGDPTTPPPGDQTPPPGDPTTPPPGDPTTPPPGDPTTPPPGQGTTPPAEGRSTPPAVQGAAPGSWTAGRVYGVGTEVTHGSVRYRCLQSHQAQGTWRPETTPALWQRVG